MKQTWQTNSEKETQSIAQKIAKTLPYGSVILLDGDLGAGKTVFTKGLAKALGVSEIVTSPTFTILNLYKATKGNFAHFDMYRIDDEDELAQLGFEEYIGDANTICAIEWWTKTPQVIPQNPLLVTITKIDDTSRKITLENEV